MSPTLHSSPALPRTIFPPDSAHRDPPPSRQDHDSRLDSHPIRPRVDGIDRPWRRSSRGTIVSRRGGAQWQSQRKRIQRDTERGRRRKRAEGWPAEGTGTDDRRRERERKREERESRRDRDPNNPSRGEESRVGRAVGSCATPFRALPLSRDSRNTRISV